MYLTKKIFVFRYYYYTYDDLDKRHVLGGYLQTQHYQSHLNDERQQKQQQEGSEDWGYGTGARDVLQTCLNVYLFWIFDCLAPKSSQKKRKKVDKSRYKLADLAWTRKSYLYKYCPSRRWGTCVVLGRFLGSTWITWIALQASQVSSKYCQVGACFADVVTSPIYRTRPFIPQTQPKFDGCNAEVAGNSRNRPITGRTPQDSPMSNASLPPETNPSFSIPSRFLRFKVRSKAFYYRNLNM